ncbi:LamG domain-containing protein [Kitasatospora mediocidica]|uniref:LamG domain-containing protein n=1 Tax=Kitasatospora mediocidica TaxID=58352 RepID=UPI000A046E73|nr:LamG domain-containing protein [Kitasatospora mediocidica]
MESGGSVGGGQDGNGGWGAPGFGPVGSTPDWAAMAEATERAARRKRLMRVGIGVVATLVVAGIVVVALVMAGPLGKKDPKPAPQPVAANCVAPTTAPITGSNDLRLGATTQVGTVDGHSGLALTTHGTPDGYAEVNSVVVNTCTSFTVSAVVRNGATDEPRAAVSQGSDGFFSFYLGRDIVGTHDQWVFKVQTAAESGKAIQSLSASPATVGQWTTLTGVYDVKAKTISLYVDGVLAKTTPAPGILSTNGPIEIGRARFKSHWVDSWNGSIADVQVWDQPLPADKVAQLAKTRSTDVAPHGTWFRF